MSEQTVATRIEELRRLLTQYEYEYYVLSQPTISDLEFDRLMHQLESLEEAHPELITPDSPTQRVGSEFIKDGLDRVGTTVSHRTPMLSLSNTYSWAEVVDFYRKVTEAIGKETNLTAELKYDGASISVIYEHGQLARAVTRGDGRNGEDITLAIRSIRSVPLRLRGADLPEYIEVRGEVLLPWADFQRINSEREEQGLEPFANPRNAVSGTIKTKENITELINYRKPTCYFYYLLSDDAAWLPELHHERLERMQELGLKVSDLTRLCHSLEELQEYIDYWDIHRHELEVATDGIVVKVDDYHLHDEIGWTAKSPKWAMAYKFSAEEAVSRLLSVSYQTARTGVVTPVANVEPVQLSGTTVQRASLHNADIISDLDLHIGDIVTLEKGGEIIPKITSVRKDLRDHLLGAPAAMPEVCPSCGTPLIRREGMAATICPNEWHCPAQVEGKIEHFCSRDAMDINIGPKTIHLLTSLLDVEDTSQLYELSHDRLLLLPGFKRQRASNLIESIEASKQKPFEKVLYALGIPLVGVQVAEKLAYHFGSLDRLLGATMDELTEVDSIGPMIAESITGYAAESRNREIIEKLKQTGLRFEVEESKEDTIQSDDLAGETIVISGVFHSISRDDLKELLKRHGAKVGSGVTGKTTLMITGDNVGPAKLKKAESLGVKTMMEADFFQAHPQLK